jgi:hypothetical protein
MIPNLHLLLLNRLQQQGVNADEAPALLRDLTKIRESGIGIDMAGRKGNCSLTTITK